MFLVKLKMASSAVSSFNSYKRGVVWSNGVLGECPKVGPLVAPTAEGLGTPDSMVEKKEFPMKVRTKRSLFPKTLLISVNLP